MQSNPLPPVAFNPQSFVPSAFSESPDNRWDVSFLSFNPGSLADNQTNGLVTDSSSDSSSFDEEMNPLGVSDPLALPAPTQQEFLQSVLAPSVVSVPALGTPAAPSDKPSGPDFSLNMLGQNSPHIMGILQKFFSQPFVALPNNGSPHSQQQPALAPPTAASPAPRTSNDPATAPVFPFVIVPTLMPQTTTLSVTPQGSWTNLVPAPSQLAASPASSTFTANLSPVSNDNASVTQSSGSSEHGEDSPHSGTRKRGGRAILDVNAWEERRQKHNEIESQRRAQLNTSYEKLQTLVRSADPGKSAILRATVDVLKNYEKKVKELEQEHQTKRRKVQEIEAKKAEQALAQKIPALTASNDPSAGMSLSIPRPLDSGVKLGPNNNAHWNGGVEHFKAFLHSGVAMHVALMNGQIVDCNEKFEELLSNKKAMISQLSVFTITHPAFVPKCYNMMNNLITGTTEIESAQEVIVDCTGSIVSVHVTCWVVREEGKPKYIMAVVVPLEAKRKNAFTIPHHDIPKTQEPRPIPPPAGPSQSPADSGMVPAIKTESVPQVAAAASGCSGARSSIEVIEDSH